MLYPVRLTFHRGCRSFGARLILESYGKLGLYAGYPLSVLLVFLTVTHRAAYGEVLDERARLRDEVVDEDRAIAWRTGREKSRIMLRPNKVGTC